MVVGYALIMVVGAMLSTGIVIALEHLLKRFKDNSVT